MKCGSQPVALVVLAGCNRQTREEERDGLREKKEEEKIWNAQRS
jgi:hypothetical protein